jgi:hypothetical protein
MQVTGLPWEVPVTMHRAGKVSLAVSQLDMCTCLLPTVVCIGHWCSWREGEEEQFGH